MQCSITAQGKKQLRCELLSLSDANVRETRKKYASIDATRQRYLLPNNGNQRRWEFAQRMSKSCHARNFCGIFTSLPMRLELRYMWRKTVMTTNTTKQPPLLEDLRSHTSEQLAELRLLLATGAESRPDPRRPGFFELDGTDDVFYVFKYPSGSKVLLVGVWARERDRVAELAACSCCSAA